MTCDLLAAWPTEPSGAGVVDPSRSLHFVLPGEPVPAARPRVFRRGGKVHTITPTKTTSYEERVGWAARSVLPRGWRADWARYEVRIDVRRGVRRGDVDNLTKSVLDGLQPIVFANDAAVARLLVEVHDDLHNPRLAVTVTALGDLDAASERRIRARTMARARREAGR